MNNEMDSIKETAMQTKARLRVLIVEDSEDDTILLVEALKSGDFDPAFDRVDTEADMRNALARQQWDIIISDYRIPGFGGLEALHILKESKLDLPFIILSGAIGEETAVEAMKAGAHDYIMKSNMARIIPAVRRELREAEIRRKSKRAEAKLVETNAQLKVALEQIKNSQS